MQIIRLLLVIQLIFALSGCEFDKPENLEEIVQRTIEINNIPGIVAYVKINEQPPLTAAAGFSNVESEAILKVTDQFRIYSITKSFTALVTLKLVEQGVIALEDKITQWLPETVIGNVPNNDQITIEQLLSHSSGVYDHLSSEMESMPPFFAQMLASQEVYSHWYTPQELINFSNQYSPYFLPGEGASYSNTGYVIMGLIIEAATESNIEDVIFSEIIEPLNLNNTYFETVETPANYVSGYQLMESGELLDISGSNTSFAWAAGSLISDIHDLGRYADALFSGELIQADSFEKMFTFITETNTQGKYWGLGVAQVDAPAGSIYAATGESIGYEAKIIYLPELKTTIIGLFNRNQAESAFDYIVESSLDLLGE